MTDRISSKLSLASFFNRKGCYFMEKFRNLHAYVMMRLKNEQGSGMKKKESFVLRSTKCPTWYFGNIDICNGFFFLETSRTYHFRMTKHLIRCSAYIELLKKRQVKTVLIDWDRRSMRFLTKPVNWQVIITIFVFCTCLKFWFLRFAYWSLELP